MKRRVNPISVVQAVWEPLGNEGEARPGDIDKPTQHFQKCSAIRERGMSIDSEPVLGTGICHIWRFVGRSCAIFDSGVRRSSCSRARQYQAGILGHAAQ